LAGNAVGTARGEEGVRFTMAVAEKTIETEEGRHQERLRFSGPIFLAALIGLKDAELLTDGFDSDEDG
jgi:hypothetical protein